MIGGRTALYGIVGHPIGHSHSPAMQNAAFAAAGLDAVYVPLPVTPDRLFEALRGAHALGFQGLNVTVPHKQRAAQICLSLDPVASIAGAVNTLRASPDGFEGFNTDAPATLALLEAAGMKRGARALLLGAGGAARAGAWALLRAGAEVLAAARDPAAAARLAEAMAGVGSAPPHPIAWEAAAAESERCQVIVNATTIGLPGAAGALPSFRFRPGQLAVDYVYGDTAFAAEAARAGAEVVSGEQILVRQGALGFALWTGRPAPEPAMAEALRAASRKAAR